MSGKSTAAPPVSAETFAPPVSAETLVRMTVSAPQGLNLRNGPGNDFDVCSILPEGAEVTVWPTWCPGTGAQGWFEFHVPGWAYVFTGELCGWVCREFLAERVAGDLV